MYRMTISFVMLNVFNKRIEKNIKVKFAWNESHIFAILMEKKHFVEATVILHTFPKTQYTGSPGSTPSKSNDHSSSSKKLP